MNAAPTSAQRRGAQAENAAAQLLEAAGLQTVARNYRCRGGEIDLVMREARALVFVEVRYRRNDRFGGALDSVNARKQRRLSIAAHHFLLHHPAYRELPARFDVVAFEGQQAPTWIRDAFEALSH